MRGQRGPGAWLGVVIAVCAGGLPRHAVRGRICGEEALDALPR